MADLDAIVKAYDIRGVVPDQLNEPLAHALGAAFVRVLQAGRIVVGHDMRPSSPGLAAAFSAGTADAGADVIAAGLCSTDMMYFASGSLDIPGAMFTASHNPARYNGIKLCRAGASPVGSGSGLDAVAELVRTGLPAPASTPGTVTDANLLGDYARYLTSLVDLSGIRPLTIVVDAGNGMAGYTVPAVLGDLPLSIEPMYFELDGTFPHHEANPLEPANLADLRAKVVEIGADAGLAFDGDADRCFVVDERGEPVSPSAITALVATRELKSQPGASIIHNLITSAAVPEIVAEHGGHPVRTRVGHSFIKAEMAASGAIFGGEHSGHFYFRNFWRADTGMLAALHVLAALGAASGPLSALVAAFSRYVASGEINSTVDDATARIAAVRAVYARVPDARIDELDGLTVAFSDHSWFNLRPSNTEPLLRLNVEAAGDARLAALRDEVLQLVRR